MLFREFVIKDWFDGNDGYEKYQNQNIIIAQECIYHYNQYQEVRNKVFHNEEKQKGFIIKQCEELQSYLEETKEY